VSEQNCSLGYWSGWVYAADADTGVWKWRLKSNYPILSGMTVIGSGFSGSVTALRATEKGYRVGPEYPF
jgi:outer membrane protein assembly factor BamB